MAETVGVAIVVLDWNGNVQFANKAAEQVCGRDLDTMRRQSTFLATDATDATDQDSQEAVRRAIQQLTRSRQHVRLTLPIYSRGKALPPRRIQADFDGQGESDTPGGVIVTLLDVTDAYEAECQLRHLATRDPLTGILNRTAITEAIDHHLLDSPQSVGIAYCDMDGFKDVNDDWGHQAGDMVLTNFADALSSITRAQDLVGRVGGDEFVVLLAGDIDLVQFADRVRNLGEDECPTGLGRIRVSIGLGRGRAGDTAADLLARADQAMYADKRAHVSDHKRKLIQGRRPRPTQNALGL